MIYRCDYETRSLRCMGDSVPIYIIIVHRSDVDWLVFDNILEVLVEVC